MSGVVTVRYLRRRFWIAELVLLVALALAAGIAVVALRAQEIRSEYALALQHLGNAVDRLEEELDRLVVHSRRGNARRDGARASFVDLLTEFRGIVLATSVREELTRRPKGLVVHDHLSDMAARFGIDDATALARQHLQAGRMPESLGRIWQPASSIQNEPQTGNLEYVLARLLRLAERLVDAEGPLRGDEVGRVETIKAIVAGLVSPRLEEITAVLDEDMHRASSRALISFLALLAIAAAVAVLNVFLIFRPLERAVMAAQASLAQERDRALEAAAAKRNFLSVMSHELRTPMNGVLGFAGLLLASELRPEQRRQVEIIRSSGKTLLSLVNNILDLSRLEAGALELGEQPFALEELIGEVLELAGAGASGKSLESAVYIDPRLPETLEGDPERVRQILTNLVGNAVKFTESGTVAVEARRLDPSEDGGPTIELLVSDTGPGVPADQQERIFERFTQARGVQRPGTEGSGLGLAICRELSERMGGNIRVESMPGRGATFRARLRLGPLDAMVGAAKHAAGPPALAGMRALVVDDNAMVSGLLRRQLEGWGVLVEEARGADEAFRQLNKAAAAGAPCGLVLIDRTLSDGDPALLAGQIRNDPRFSGCGLLLLAEAGSRHAATATEAGFDAVEQPPVMPRALLATLSRLVGREPPAAARRDAASARANILLAEDQAVSQELVVDLLTGAGHHVDVVGDGPSAVEAAARQAYDLVLMDLRMPGLDGVEASRRIRALDGAAGRVPIIALTANASCEEAIEQRAAGMNGIIAKPIKASRLLTAVARALRAGALSPSAEAGAAARGMTRPAPEASSGVLAATR